ncbi:MAG TPA: hypothetical protein VNQ99_17695 [Xanthobacteraceae bacterium]|nr:hypothetical protein [Xanthobacteraceae bacterium]
MTDRLRDICRDLDIEIIEVHQTQGPGQTRAVKTMERIMNEHGEGHLIMVLRTIMESANNKTELVAPTIWAISDLILAHPEWPDTGLAWLEAFDGISLPQIRQKAKGNRSAAQPRAAICTLINDKLLPIFGDNRQGRLDV